MASEVFSVLTMDVAINGETDDYTEVKFVRDSIGSVEMTVKGRHRSVIISEVDAKELAEFLQGGVYGSAKAAKNEPSP